MKAIGKDDRWHLELKHRWVEQYNSTGKADGVRVMALQIPEGIVAQILNSAAENKGVNLEFKGKCCI
jgi:hypothetical protein